jgi:hypothetical protein
VSPLTLQQQAAERAQSNRQEDIEREEAARERDNQEKEELDTVSKAYVDEWLEIVNGGS